MNKFKIIILIIIFSILSFLAINYSNIFIIEKIDIKGNSYYSNEEIEEIILNENNNSIFIFLKYSLTKNEYPFIEDINIKIKSPKYIEVNVKEKNIIGYTNYMGMNLYFDNDGILLESSYHNINSIPYIEGISFNYIELNKEIEVKNSRLFNVLNLLMQSLKKYNLSPNRILVENNCKKISIYFDGIKINIGNGDNMDDKANRIKDILPELEGEKGTLYMENYTNESVSISFIKNKE